MNLKRIFNVAVVLISLATLSVADFQNDILGLLAGGGLSTQCATALVGGLLSNPCIPFLNLLPAIIPLFSQDPLKNPELLNAPTQVFCDAQKNCPEDTVEKLTKELESQCKDDIKHNSLLVAAFLGVFEMYTPIVTSMCFPGVKLKFCYIETISNYAQLKADNPVDLLQFAPPSVGCTSCNEAMVKTFDRFIKDHPDSFKFLKSLMSLINPKADVPALLKQMFQVKCGLAMFEGGIPDTRKSSDICVLP